MSRAARPAERGFVLLAVVVALALIAAGAFVLNREGPQGAARAGGALGAERARYVAEAGLQHALWQSQKAGCDGYPTASGAPFGADSYDVAVKPAEGSPVTVVSTATLADGSARMLRREGVRIFADPASVALQPGPEGKDVVLEVALPGGNVGADTKFRIDAAEGSHVLLQFDLSAIPVDTEVRSATLALFVESWSGSAKAGTLNVHRVKRSWVEGNGTAVSPSTDGATYDTHDGASPWSTPGGDYDPAVIASTWVDLAVGRITLDLTPLVRDWVNGKVPNHGLLLRTPDTLDKVKFPSSDDSQPLLRPALLLSTACECGQDCADLVYRDEFRARSCVPSLDWAQSHGTLDWSPTPWVEFGEGQDSCGGDIRIDSDQGSYAARFTDTNKGIQRPADLSKFDSAILSFDYRRENLADAGEYLSVGVSGNGGADWSEVARLAGPADDAGYQSASYDISSFRSADAMIRFEAVDMIGTPSPRFYLDNVQIAEGGGVAAGTVLLVVPDAASLSTQDAIKQALIESWGHSVTPISASDSQAAFDAAVASADAAYISEEVSSSQLGSKLKAAPIGIVNEEIYLADDFGLGELQEGFDDDEIAITDDTHYITWASGGTGPLAITTSVQPLHGIGGALAPELRVLATAPAASSRGLAVLERNAALWGGGTAAGRRVQLPWGGDAFDVTSLGLQGEVLMRRSLEWALGASPPPPPGAVLFVVGDPAALTAQEELRKAALEGWGYVVSPIDSQDSQASFDAALENAGVAYVSEEVSSSDVGTKLTDTIYGVVNEEAELTDEIGFSSSRTWPFDDTLTITDDTHHITSPFPAGPLVLSSASQSNAAVGGTLAPGLRTLAQWNTDATLAVLEPGDPLWSGGTATGPRVELPWGGSAFDFALLTADGLTLLRRSLEWARAAGGPAQGPLTLAASADAYMKSDKPDETRGTENQLIVKLDKRQTVVRFDLAGLPSAPLESAILRLWVENNALDSDAQADVFALTEAFDEPDVSWDHRTASDPWTVGGGTHSLPAVDSRILSENLEADWFEMDLTPLVQEWLDGITTNHGIVLKINQNKDVKFTSREGGASQSPQLVVTYAP